MTPWTPRERALREALEKAIQGYRNLLEFRRFRWNEDEHRYGALTKHEIQVEIDFLSNALADPPPPDPMDEALNQAEAELLRLWKLVPPGRAGVGGVRTIELEDDEVARLRQIVDIIRAAKGGA